MIIRSLRLPFICAALLALTLSGCSKDTVQPQAVISVEKTSPLMFNTVVGASEQIKWNCYSSDMAETSVPESCLLEVEELVTCEFRTLKALDPAIASEPNTITAAAKGLWAYLLTVSRTKLNKVSKIEAGALSEITSPPLVLTAEVPYDAKGNTKKIKWATVGPIVSPGFVGQSGFRAPSSDVTINYLTSKGNWTQAAATKNDLGTIGLVWHCSLTTQASDEKIEEVKKWVQTWAHDKLFLVKVKPADMHGNFVPKGAYQ